MSDSGSLSARARAELFSVASVVTLTAAVLAVGALFVTETWSDSYPLVFGVMGAIGVGVPSLFREWSVDLPVTEAVLWTVAVSVIAYVIYALVARFSIRLGANTDLGAVLALAVTASLGIGFSLYRTKTT